MPENNAVVEPHASPDPRLQSSDPKVEEVEARITELLKGLGETPYAIADKFRTAGIKGQRENEYSCPIATYLTGVMGVTCRVTGQSVWALQNSACVDLTAAAESFVERFDYGNFADLAL